MGEGAGITTGTEATPESIKNGKAVPPLRRGTFFSVWGSFLRATRWSLGYSTATTYRYSLDGVRDKFEIDASTMAIKQSFVTCGGYISIRPYTMFGTTKIDLDQVQISV
ncbi:hypothetical protein JCM14720_05190 [Calditerricola yamamurae]